MRDSLRDFLRCPDCSGNLSISNTEYTDDLIMNGRLFCNGCNQSFEIVNCIPRFVPGEMYTGSFGFQWKRFYDVQIDVINKKAESEQTFTQKTGLTSEDVKGKALCDAGMGSGRFAEVVCRWGL